jgi:putative transposase
MGSSFRVVEVSTRPRAIHRRRVFASTHLDRLREAFSSVCSDAGDTLEEFNGEDNHVHLLVNFPPNVPLSRLVNSLKGVG